MPTILGGLTYQRLCSDFAWREDRMEIVCKYCAHRAERHTRCPEAADCRMWEGWSSEQRGAERGDGDTRRLGGLCTCPCCPQYDCTAATNSSAWISRMSSYLDVSDRVHDSSHLPRHAPHCGASWPRRPRMQGGRKTGREQTELMRRGDRRGSGGAPTSSSTSQRSQRYRTGERRAPPPPAMGVIAARMTAAR
jgi:hypothetical protein